MAENGFTRTQQAMLDVLSDGMRHPRRELHACLPDELGPLSNIGAHLTAIRKVLHPQGQDIICVYYQRALHYQHVRLIVR